MKAEEHELGSLHRLGEDWYLWRSPLDGSRYWRWLLFVVVVGSLQMQKVTSYIGYGDRYGEEGHQLSVLGT